MSTVSVETTSPPSEQPSAALMVARRWCGLLAPSAIWSAMSLYYFSTFVRDPSHGIVGGPDGVLFAWFFQSVEHSLAQGQNPFVSHAMNAPTGVSLMWNTALILPAVILAPLTAAVGGLAVAGWLMVLAPVLSATTAYFVLRRLTGVVFGSALVATLYGFGPFFVGQASHLHLVLAAPALPLFLLLGHRLFVRQTGNPVRPGIWLGLVVGVTLLIGEEIVATGLVMAVIAIVAGVIVERGTIRRRLRYAAIGVGTAAGVALVLLAVPLYYQFFGPLALSGGVVQGNQPLDLTGLVRPSSLQYYARASDIAANHRFPANGVENTGYLGLPLIALVIGVLIWLARRRDRFALWWTLTALSAIVLSLGTRLWVNGTKYDVPLPWYLFKQLPLLHAAITIRFSVVTTLLIALLLVYALARLPQGRPYVIGLILIALCLLSLRPSKARDSPYEEIVPIATPRFFVTSAVDAIKPGSTALLLPQGAGPFVAQDSMYWQIQAKFRFNIVGGYADFNDHGVSTFTSPLPAVAATLVKVSETGTAPSDDQLVAGRASVAPSTIKYIVITDQVSHRDEVISAAAAITGCTPRPVSDVVLCEVPQS